MTEHNEMPEYVLRNRAVWDRWAPDWVASGERNWADPEPSWGIWGIPESELRLMSDVAGLDVIELGCGTAYVSSWLARLGARPVGIDNSPKQLETAGRLQREHGLDFPRLLGNAESVPCPDSSFDLAISEYGACIWADPYRWIPEAARLLRPGGRLSFLGNAFLFMLCTPNEDDTPPTDRLLRDQFGAFRFEWPADESVEFHLPHGEMIRLLRANGFEVEDLIEIQAPKGAATRFKWIDPEWAHRWPTEEVWKARKRD
jgi:SAM-dependent methyltransferase